MAIIQCERLHYYDSAKDSICPYCIKQDKHSSAFGGKDPIREQETVYMEGICSEGQLTEVYGEEIGEGDKTISFYSDELENLFTVGWLVCMNGPVKGKSYTLHRGRNHAGRSMDMDIVLSDDVFLSLEKHFSIVYDPKDSRFYIVAGTGRTYVNHNHLREEKELSEGDVISAGESEYIFIPFCKVGRSW